MKSNTVEIGKNVDIRILTSKCFLFLFHLFLVFLLPAFHSNLYLVLSNGCI